MSDDLSLSEIISKAVLQDQSIAPDSPQPSYGDKLGQTKLFFQIRQLAGDIDKSDDIHQLRLRYTKKLFWIALLWIFVVVVFVFMIGFKCKGFTITENVQIAFITSTTVNVLGLFGIVAKWMFPGQNPKKDE